MESLHICGNHLMITNAKNGRPQIGGKSDDTVCVSMYFGIAKATDECVSPPPPPLSLLVGFGQQPTTTRLRDFCSRINSCRKSWQMSPRAGRKNPQSHHSLRTKSRRAYLFKNNEIPPLSARDIKTLRRPPIYRSAG